VVVCMHNQRINSFDIHEIKIVISVIKGAGTSLVKPGLR